MEQNSSLPTPPYKKRMSPVRFDLPNNILRRVDAIGRQRADKPTRAQVLRELIIMGLAAHERGP